MPHTPQTPLSVGKIGHYPFLAEPFHVDFSGRLPISVLGNQLLNAADFHSKERGFGIPFLQAHNCTWVLSRLAIEIIQLPEQYEEYIIDTWVEDVFRLFTSRNFCVRRPDGTPIAYARSIWAMIDLPTRKPHDLIALRGNELSEYICPEEPCPIEKPSRIQLKEGKDMLTYTPRYSDIDINGHFNSIKYMEHALNLFPIDHFRTRSVKRFEMAYVAESYAGDTLNFYLDRPAPDEYCIEIKKNADEVVCRSKIQFREI